MAQAVMSVLACNFFARCGEAMVGAKGLGIAFIETLSICSGRCVVRYLEFETIWVMRNGN
jgi:hypothetical protein